MISRLFKPIRERQLQKLRASCRKYGFNIWDSEVPMSLSLCFEINPKIKDIVSGTYVNGNQVQIQKVRILRKFGLSAIDLSIRSALIGAELMGKFDSAIVNTLGCEFSWYGHIKTVQAAIFVYEEDPQFLKERACAKCGLTDDVIEYVKKDPKTEQDVDGNEWLDDTEELCPFCGFYSIPVRSKEINDKVEILGLLNLHNLKVTPSHA